MAAGAHDGHAVAVLADRAAGREQAQTLTGLEPRLAATDRPEPDLSGNDQLLRRETAR